MILQGAGDYEESAAVFIRAADRIEELERYSISKGGASLVVNDNVQEFRGTPFERTLLHAFTAKSFLALGAWDNAAVEARRMLNSLSPEVKDDYPDDAYSRYMAGFCLQLQDDPSNAALQFRKAGELTPSLRIDENTGRIHPVNPTLGEVAGGSNDAEADTGAWAQELVCFVLMGRSLRGAAAENRWLAGEPGYAEFYHQGDYLGRSYPLADTVELALATEQIDSTRKAIKTATRIVIKEAIAESVEHETDSDALGFLVRLVLIGLLEQPDVRRWESLPRSLQVARLPCPGNLDGFDVAYKNAAGFVYRKQYVRSPISRHRDTFISFCRDVNPPVKPPLAE